MYIFTVYLKLINESNFVNKFKTRWTKLAIEITAFEQSKDSIVYFTSGH